MIDSSMFPCISILLVFLQNLIVFLLVFVENSGVVFLRHRKKIVNSE